MIKHKILYHKKSPIIKKFKAKFWHKFFISKSDLYNINRNLHWFKDCEIKIIYYKYENKKYIDCNINGISNCDTYKNLRGMYGKILKLQEKQKNTRFPYLKEHNKFLSETTDYDYEKEFNKP